MGLVKLRFLEFFVVIVLFIEVGCSLFGIRETERFRAGYREKGLASWYGIEEHGKPTASGEPFNMFDYTAAHRRLPFGSLVEVTNLKNDKKVVVRINDRGPFIAGRIIDLSYLAAKRIDMLEDGIVPVEIRVIGFEAKPKGNLNRTFYGYYVQVGAFLDKNRAYNLRDLIKMTFGKDGEVIAVVVDNRIFYRVLIGPFTKEAEARGFSVDVEGIAGTRGLVRDYR
ncbi:MAG: septal ring lytic transglycosylase RlpA family protein [Thermosulfidibacteraceae bacterium]|jgi:rare lipoprotein A